MSEDEIVTGPDCPECGRPLRWVEHGTPVEVRPEKGPVCVEVVAD